MENPGSYEEMHRLVVVYHNLILISRTLLGFAGRNQSRSKQSKQYNNNQFLHYVRFIDETNIQK